MAEKKEEFLVDFLYSALNANVPTEKTSRPNVLAVQWWSGYNY